MTRARLNNAGKLFVFIDVLNSEFYTNVFHKFKVRWLQLVFLQCIPNEAALVPYHF